MSDSDQPQNLPPRGLGEPPKLVVPSTPTPPVQVSVDPAQPGAAPIADFSAANAYNATVEKPVLTKKQQRQLDKEKERASRPDPSEEELEAAKKKRKKILSIVGGVTVGAVAVGGFSWWAATRPAGPDPVVVEYASLAEEYDSLKTEKANLMCAEVGEAVKVTSAYTRLGPNRGALLAYTGLTQFTGGEEVPFELSYVLADAYNQVNPDALSGAAAELAQKYGEEADPTATCLAAESAPLPRVESPLERDVEGLRQEISGLEEEVATLGSEEAGPAVVQEDIWVAAQDDKDDLQALLATATPASELEIEFAEADPALLEAVLESREALAQAEEQLAGEEYNLEVWVDTLDALIKYTLAADDLIFAEATAEENTDGEN